jgi:predicted dehydrogenase
MMVEARGLRALTARAGASRMPGMNRRKFLQVSSAAGLALCGPGLLRGDPAGQIKRAGLIGCGWYGKGDLCRLIQVAPVEVVSLCDVDRDMLAGAAELIAARQKSKRKPRTYGDYRQMLSEKDLDVVLVGTPDHWHALATIAAIESGADVYVQKPICVDVVEGQAMLAAARRHQRVVQAGLERRSTPHLIEARDEIIRAGKLGTIAQVEIYCYYPMRARENPPDIAPPANLDYELWTGPAPMRPFNRLTHPRGWRNFMEYSNGIIGDMGVHMFDMTRWMLGLDWPKTISSSGGILVEKESKANTPDTQRAVFDYGDLQILWQHRCWGDAPDPKYTWGANFYGDEGTLKTGVWSYDFIPKGGGRSLHRDATLELDQYPEDRTEEGLETFAAPANRRNLGNFMSCVATRGRPVADIEEGYISTACCILANLSLKLGRSLRWDSQAGQVAGDAEANSLLRRPYRAPWRHPEPGAV